nr:bifunctional phosphoribosyl-AMP cyclohydrolase/phosphoribosyl-ATP diphosphatase HisIE [Chloroflexota bacterium]
VLMLAWANTEALAATEKTGEAHFWSRSRGRLWRKGEASGNVMHVVGLVADCDGDAILYRVRPEGPACHTGTRTCFGETDAPGVLSEVAAVIERRRGADAETSHTARLLSGGPRRPAEKVVEEAGETAVAALAGTEDELASEAADLLYHLLVLLASRPVPFERVLEVLRERRSQAISSA